MRLVDQSIADCHTRAQFFAIAANLMRQILVNHAVRHKAAKRGDGNKATLNEAVAVPGVGTVADVAGLIGGVLNDAGQIFFWATMKDGRGVLLLATPSTPLGK
jgi:hypothetical protein